MRKCRVFGTDGREYWAVSNPLFGFIDIEDACGGVVDEAFINHGLLVGYIDDYHSSEIYNFLTM